MIRGHEKLISQLYVLFDLFFLLVAFGFAWLLKFNPNSPFASTLKHLPMAVYFEWILFYGICAVTLGYILNLYTTKRKKTLITEMSLVIQIHIYSTLLLLSVLFFTGTDHYSRGFLIIFIVSTLVCIGLYRLAAKMTLSILRQKGFNRQYVLIVGAGKVGRKFYRNLENHPEFGVEVFGFLDDNLTEHNPEYADYKPILGSLDLLESIIEKETLDEVVIALPLSAHEKYKKIVAICENAGLRVLIIPDYYDILPAKPQFQMLDDLPVINIRDIPLDEIRNRLFKRMFDILFSLFIILITSPVLLAIALIVKLTSPGSVIFKQERVGMNNRTFVMYKFRSMRMDDDKVNNTFWTVKDDQRRTPFGTFLRRTSLDELPQFFNVLKGDMSVVGPRPERPHFVNLFKEDVPKYMIKHHVRPGITGWAQINGFRGDTSIVKRVNCDLFYIENWSFILDIKIIAKTIITGFVNKNAY
ncbi:undecaprenyl-phosphate glucose phosphotransferase [Pullulanibacillus sp. KACC 23026]|uniref:undecaprenyl-phosphate glucose phosphotransferase n=1 Tax=Pullulanibacillus sp. KACC 23026 TaxID=3028315 RepID=UPI0023AF9893|nr:undecaprenyl-phosphate glucose phosphotransferase [Pullulanibacillus sp. KACC 23026]WEG13304.1 undecaprenyl-phosphate glucose phosphotransferase [Pullulanibacillus sp. KACC 23026]